MSPAMTRGAAASTLLHAAILAALLLSLPGTPRDDSPPPPDVEFEVVSDQARQVTKAAEASPTPAAAVAAVANPVPPAAQPPMAAQRQPPPPVPTPPVPTPPVPPRPAQVSPPLPVPPPEVAPAPALPLPPPPAPPRPLPPLPLPPRPQPPVAASQPSPVKAPGPDLRAVDNALQRFRLAQQQVAPPAANPTQGGAPRMGGSPTGDVTAKLTGEQRGAIGDKVRECWTKDEGALDLEKMSVMMTVTLDAAGVVRDAVVGDADRGKLADPRFRAFAERARRANLDSHCANLSDELPKAQLGHVVKLTFRFRP